MVLKFRPYIVVAPKFPIVLGSYSILRFDPGNSDLANKSP